MFRSQFKPFTVLRVEVYALHKIYSLRYKVQDFCGKWVTSVNLVMCTSLPVFTVEVCSA
jgi:hypothetical protein